MKKLYFLFLLMLLPMLASAADKVEIDGIYYELSTGETKTATVISGTNKYSGEVVIPETVTYNEETYSVTSIGGMTFLKIGNSISSIGSIGNSAFCNCTGLTSVTIPNSVTSIGDGAFWGCTGLTSLTIGSNVASIGIMAFGHCSGLTSVSIPKSVTSIGNFAFYDCNSLVSINVETGNSEYDSRDNCNAIIETQSNTLLSGCNNTIMPSNVISIADKAFYNCSGLTSVTIPNGVTFIGEDAFHACSGLTSVTIPNSVTSIGNLAFSDCSGLTSVTIPNSVTSIGLYPFRACRSLTSIEVEGGNTKYDSRDNCNAIIETQSNTLMSGCKNTFIPNGVTSIGDYAFYASGLTSVTIPNSVTSIGNYAFWACGMTSVTIPNSVTFIGALAFKYCNKLTSVTIPNSVTSISNDVFNNCSKLTSVTIPNSVTSIGSCAFESCVSLKDVYCYAENVPETRASAFTYCNLDNMSLHVPAGSVEAYKSTEPWNQFKEIKAIEDSNEFSLNFMGQTIKDGAMLLINAEGWSALGNIYTDPDGNTKNGLFVFVNKGGKVSGSYSLEILSNTLNGDLKWSMGGETYALNEVTKLEKSFSTDENGIASVKFSAENIPNEGSLDAKLMVTIGEKTKTFYIKIQFKKKDSPDLTVSGKVGEPVDLGLSVKWASWNVGAGAPEEYGNHYAWGELEPKTDYSASTYKFYNSGYTKYGSIDNKYELDEADDVARQKWGEDWRMPTFDELKELYEKCSFSNETYNGVPVTKVTGPNGNYIYMPGPGNFTGQTLYFKNSVGSYWSRDLETDSYAKDLDFFTSYRSLNGDTRYHGQSIRPVYVGDLSKRIVHVTEAGTLPTLISEAEKYLIEDLTITGELNGTDFRLLRDMAGNNYKGELTDGKLRVLDLSKVSIVEGGDFYLDAKIINYSSKRGSGTTSSGSGEYYTSKDMFSCYLFAGCCALQSIKLPAEVSTIEEAAFASCKYLTSVVIPDKVTTIKVRAFDQCDALSSIELPASVTSFVSAFVWCTGLTSIVVKEGNTKYDSRDNCNAVIETATNQLIMGISTSVIPNTVTGIGRQAFLASPMTSITIPSSVTTIEEGAFQYSQLKSITIPKTVTFLGQNIVQGCEQLTSISVESGNLKYDSRDDCNAIIETESNTLVSGCATTIIPASVTSIGNKGFAQCSLKSISIPNTVRIIGSGAFVNCNGLKSIIIPEGVQTIDKSAFGECYGLERVDLPSTLTSIANDGFANTNSLKTIISRISNPFPIDESVFSNKSATLFVPESSVDAYKATAAWNSFNTILSLESSLVNIEFADPKVKEICVANWDTDGDGELSKFEASLVTGSGIKNVFSNNQDITSFDEFEFFVGVKDNFSFQGCSNLKSIKIPNSVTSIGNEAFSICDGLTSVTIPNSVTSIGNDAFWSCQKLSSVTISNSVTSIGNRAFSNCKKLTSIVVESGNMVYDSRENCNAIIETSTNTLITGCKETIIPNSVTSIGDEAFSGSGLTTINLSSNITSIGKRAFGYCEDLESLSLSKNVSYIGELAFSGCWSLISIIVDSENAKYDSRNDCNAIIETATNTLVAGCTNTVIPESVKSIGKCGMGQSGIATFTIPGNVETIEDYGFYNCPDLVFLVVSEGVKTIGSYAFESCALENLILPSTIEYIGSRTFSGNQRNISSVTIYAENVPQTEVDAFKYSNLDNAILYVPYGTKSEYEQAEGWKGFKNIVEMAETESIKISSAKQVTYMSDKNLDFTAFPNLKAYVATGYDKASGTIWLTRVKEVPANTGFLLMGEADTYEIPVKAGGLSAYYQNMFKGTIEGTTIQTTDGDYTNYYLSNGDAGVGFYKVQGSVELKPNRAYLSVPTEIPAVGAAGSTETIKVSAAGQVPYCNSQSLDFSSLDAQGVKAYTATGYDYTSGTIWLTRVKQVPAKTGILIMAPEGEYPVPTASVSSVYANMFRGTLEGTTIQTHEEIDGKDYINYYLSSGASGVGFYRVTKEEGVKIGANRCYLPILNKDAAAGTRSTSSDVNQIAFEESDEVIGIQLLRGIGGDDDGTTSIKEVKSEGVKSEEWYTLQGQRVAKPGKGLYIRNGKMVIVR